MLREMVDEVRGLIAVADHAHLRIPPPMDDAEARRLCDTVLVGALSTTIEQALAGYLLGLLGSDETRDSPEQRAIDVMQSFLRSNDADHDVSPWLHLMRSVDHPLTKEYTELTDALVRIGPREMGVDVRDVRSQAIAQRADEVVRGMRQQVAEHELANAGSLRRLPSPEDLQASATGDPLPAAVREVPGFVECPTCAAKPGTPTLCESCLHNRAVIGQLVRLFEVAAQLRDRQLSIKARICWRDRQAVGMLDAVVDDMVANGWSLQ